MTFSRLAALEAAGAPYALLTVVAVRGSAPREPGARMVVHPDGAIEGTIGGGGVEKSAIADARAMLEGRLGPGEHVLRSYLLNMALDQCCGGEVEVHIAAYRAHPEVLLIGAGHVSHALARVLADVPVRVTVIDDRSDWNTDERFPGASRIVDAPEDVLLDYPLIPDRTYAVILSHSHKRDFETLRLLVPRGLRYLGLIGSRSKWGRFRHALLAQGFRPEDVERVRCPIGIGISGKTAGEIAVSAAAEILGVRDGLDLPRAAHRPHAGEAETREGETARERAARSAP